jgi:hypothetical protein
MDDLSIYKQIFKREPELQDNIFIVKRIDETMRFLTKILQGLPKDAETQKCFQDMIAICKVEMDCQMHTLGYYVIKMMFQDMGDKGIEEIADAVCTNKNEEKQKEINL